MNVIVSRTVRTLLTQNHGTNSADTLVLVAVSSALAATTPVTQDRQTVSVREKLARPLKS